MDFDIPTTTTTAGVEEDIDTAVEKRADAAHGKARREELFLKPPDGVIEHVEFCNGIMRVEDAENTGCEVFCTYKGRKWPMKTDRKCLHCSQNFSCPPRMVPMPQPNSVIHNSPALFGNWCGAPCGVAYLLEKRWPDKEILIARLRQMEVEVFGNEKRTIKVAPQRELHQDFLGPQGYGNEEFHSDDKTIRRIIERPFQNELMLIEARSTDPKESATYLDGTLCDEQRQKAQSKKKPTDHFVRISSLRNLSRPTEDVEEIANLVKAPHGRDSQDKAAAPFTQFVEKQQQKKKQATEEDEDSSDKDKDKTDNVANGNSTKRSKKIKSGHKPSMLNSLESMMGL